MVTGTTTVTKKEACGLRTKTDELENREKEKRLLKTKNSSEALKERRGKMRQPLPLPRLHSVALRGFTPPKPKEKTN
jgi:hypothetical protein